MARYAYERLSNDSTALLEFETSRQYAHTSMVAVFEAGPLGRPDGGVHYANVDAEELVSDGKAGVLVRGFRGAAAADGEALVDLVHRLARLGLDLPAVAELDLNPVLALPDRCVVVDARVRVAHVGAEFPTKTW